MSFSIEAYYLFAVFVFILLALTTQPDARRDYYIALCLAVIGMGITLPGLGLKGDLFNEVYRVDFFSQVFKVLLSIGLFLVVFLCSELNGISERYHTEFYLLLNTCTLAMMLLVSSVHLLTIYVALELSSYCLYVLVFLRKGNSLGIGVSLRYFLIGATASAIMLFGMALLYSVAGTAYLIQLVKFIPKIINQPMVGIGLLLCLTGFFFKLAVFPFHFWAPEVYQSAANQLAAYIATASKVAAIAILMRIIALCNGQSHFLVEILIALAVLSMTVGNLSALAQKDLKRLLAYSSIAHAGYMLIGVLSMNSQGYVGVIFYSVALLLMKFACFMVIILVADDGRNLNIDHLAGLHRRAPLLALTLMLALFGLAGIPPTIGFTGKLLIFSAAIKNGYLPLVLIAMLNVVISLYYYLMVLKAAYLTEPEIETNGIDFCLSDKIISGFLITIMVVAGIYPTIFIQIAEAATRALMM
ncbi:MAG: NADH-quinone oxidoreductase subunit N [Desulfobacteraceae bacterium]